MNFVLIWFMIIGGVGSWGGCPRFGESVVMESKAGVNFVSSKYQLIQILMPVLKTFYDKK